MSDEEVFTAEAGRAAEIRKRLHEKEIFVTRVRNNRHYIKHPGETTERPESLCNTCGGSHVARGYCTNCGAKA
ncbi:MAG TPA: hypothetical protein VEA41_03595 [Salinarimonas sp.]|nr:hypothetical protein [Salinarimonas sp.]